MIDLDCETRRRGDLTLVTAVVTNARTTPQTVRLESRLDGPALTPRRRPAPDRRWDGRRWEGRILPGRSRGVGFATPAPPTDPPLALVDATRSRSASDPEPSDVLASLPARRPPIESLEGTCERRP